jgi:type IV fimbrial biogenesis protein FimT
LGELLTACAVVVIVSTVALPSYRTIIRNAWLTTQIYEFNAALNFACSEAVKRGMSVTVCPSADQASCTSSTQCEQGWIVFVDADADHSVSTTDAREVMLRANGALTTGYTLCGTSGALDSFVTMNSKGHLSASGEFVLCENGAIDPSRAILVNAVGRITIATDDDGVPVDANGNDMTTRTP